jgi:hypothetical protein
LTVRPFLPAQRSSLAAVKVTFRGAFSGASHGKRYFLRTSQLWSSVSRDKRHSVDHNRRWSAALTRGTQGFQAKSSCDTSPEDASGSRGEAAPEPRWRRARARRNVPAQGLVATVRVSETAFWIPTGRPRPCRPRRCDLPSRLVSGAGDDGGNVVAGRSRSEQVEEVTGMSVVR